MARTFYMPVTQNGITREVTVVADNKRDAEQYAAEAVIIDGFDQWPLVSPRTYLASLPVWVTVHEDGRVLLNVDITEVDVAISEEDAQPDGADYTEAAVELDMERIQNAVRQESIVVLQDTGTLLDPNRPITVGTRVRVKAGISVPPWATTGTVVKLNDTPAAGDWYLYPLVEWEDGRKRNVADTWLERM